MLEGSHSAYLGSFGVLLSLSLLIFVLYIRQFEKKRYDEYSISLVQFSFRKIVNYVTGIVLQLLICWRCYDNEHIGFITPYVIFLVLAIISYFISKKDEY